MQRDKAAQDFRRAREDAENRTWKLEIPGRRVPRPAAPPGGDRAASDGGESGRLSDLVSVRDEEVYRLDAGRGDQAETREEVDGRKLVELDLGEGLRWWTTVGELALLTDVANEAEGGRSAAAAGSAGTVELVGDGAGSLRVPAGLAGADDRGIGRLVIEGLRLLAVEFADELIESGARASASKVAEAIDGRLRTGLRFTPDPAEPGRQIRRPAELEGSEPILVFLHGTLSTTEGSFGDLGQGGASEGTWRELVEDYGEGRVLAFDHKTLTESPIRNAVDLLDRLPRGARLHLVSHSRGGMVGELLCFGRLADGSAGLSDADLARFSGRPGDLEDLRRLDALLREKKPAVERFVRVACPAAGTHLMSDRIDRAFSLLLNLLGWVPGLAGSDTYFFVKTFLLALIESRQEAEDFPGLEAMIPSSPLVQMLALSQQRFASELAVLSGDLERAPRLGRLAEIGLDRIFRQDHDLVVHTESMRRGGRRVGGEAFDWSSQGPTTHHFSYFENRGRRLPKILRDGPRQVDGFRPLDMDALRSAPRGTLRSAAEVEGARPVAVVLPGVMGTRLAADGDVIWVDADDLLLGGIRRLEHDAQGVSTAGLVEDAYADLVEFLDGSHQVVPFPYDWRRSIEEAAGHLLELLEELLDATDQPIRLVAHSMGGVVALASRLPRLDEGGVWNRLGQRAGFRFLMLGVPSRGSHVIPAIVFAREKIVKYLYRFVPSIDRRELLGIVGEYRGLYDLLPSYGDDDFFAEDSWTTWQEWDEGHEEKADRWPTPLAEDLKQARDLRQDLDASLPRLVEELGEDAVIYVAGRAEETPFDIRRRPSRWWRKSRLDLLATDQGDGRVTWDSGPPPGVRTYWVEAVHGAIPAHAPAHAAYLELLESGRTARLRSNRPASRGAATIRSWTEEEAALFPDAGDLAAAALGGGAEPVAEAARPPVEVRVVQGDLTYATAPVMVGHYEDDDIFSAEAVLDETLDYELSTRLRIGLYPGVEGTAEYFASCDDDRTGAVIIGLGRVGELSPGRLERAIRTGAVRYAVDHHDMVRRRTAPRSDEPDDGGLGLAAVLIGSGEGTGITIEDSISALVRGVLYANRVLEKTQNADVRIGRLDIFELFEDRAVCAGRALQRVAEDPQIAAGPDRIRAEPQVQWVAGGVSRLRCAGEDGWWRRLQIVVAEGPESDPPEDRPLVFTSLSDRARAEVESVATQRRLVEGFVARLVDEARWSSAAASTLFELLIPNRLKDYAPDQRDLVLVLDKHAASYPWELIEDSYEGEGKPVSVRSGMIRQLKTRTFRAEVEHPVARRALVLGDPVSHLPPLPGAQAEARQVAALLRHAGWEVDLLISPSPELVLEKLFTVPYRLVHVAAHGVLDSESRERGGLVLGEDARLTPGELRQMRRVPEIFFVNCCHLGAVERAVPDEARKHRNEIAASFGVELIQMGVRAIVAAGWVVNDQAAKTFAERFYDSMLQRSSFGEAVKTARRATHAEHRAYNTWGAYQCYGDPAYELRDDAAGAARGDAGDGTPDGWEGAPPVAPAEVENLLRGLASRAQAGDADRLHGRVHAIEEMLENRRPEWLERADIQAALGVALTEVAGQRLLDVYTGTVRRSHLTAHGKGDPFEHAIAHFQRALTCDHGDCDLMILQLLAKLRGRRAIQRWRYPDVDQPEGGVDLADLLRRRRREASDELDGIIERWDGRSDLCGSVFSRCAKGETQKRRAQVARSDSARLGELVGAAETFDEAYRQNQMSRVPLGAYAVVGWCSVRLVGRLIFDAPLDSVSQKAGEFWSGVDLEEIPLELHAAVEGGAGGKTFWMLSSRGDVEMLRLLYHSIRCGDDGLAELRRTLEEHGEAAVEYYRRGFERGSPRQVATKIEEIDWFIDLLGDGRREPALESVATAVPAAAEFSPALRRSLCRSLLADVRRRVVASLAEL